LTASRRRPLGLLRYNCSVACQIRFNLDRVCWSCLAPGSFDREDRVTHQTSHKEVLISSLVSPFADQGESARTEYTRWLKSIQRPARNSLTIQCHRHRHRHHHNRNRIHTRIAFYSFLYTPTTRVEKHLNSAAATHTHTHTQTHHHNLATPAFPTPPCLDITNHQTTRQELGFSIQRTTNLNFSIS